jgi:hypothetical protein
VIFSRSTKMLDLIERGLNFHGFGFQRIDGQTTLENRGDALRQFSDVPECTVMLASIGSCGEGYDFSLVAAFLPPHLTDMLLVLTLLLQTMCIWLSLSGIPW